MTKASVVGNLGARVVGSAGGDTGGITAITSRMPLVGSIIGSGAVLEATRKSIKRKKK